MPFHYLLLTALLLGNVLLRTFTNGFQVLPKILNVVDIPIVGLLFLTYLARSGQVSPPPWTHSVRRRAFAFAFILFLGCILNPDFIFLPAALSQAIMLLEPLLLFIALVNLPITPGQVVSYSRLLKGLILFELLIGFLQLPIRFKTGDSEAVHGTFTGNAEHYGAFLMISAFYLIGLAVAKPGRRLRFAGLILLIIVLNLSIDNKASWLGLACSLTFVLWKLELLRGRVIRIVAPIVLLALIGLGTAFIASKTSRTTYKFVALFEVIRNGEIHRLGKVKSYLDIARSHFANPHMLLVGAGPSNLYSRSARQFYYRGAESAMYTSTAVLEQGGADDDRASNSMGRWLTPTTKEPYYLQFYRNRDLIIPIGSAQVDGVFSVYAGLLGETGIIGFVLYLSIYFLALRKLVSWVWLLRRDTVVFPLLVAAMGYMVYLMVNSVYGPLLETTRLTTLLWSFVALVSIYARAAELQLAALQQSAAAEAEPDPAVFARPVAG